MAYKDIQQYSELVHEASTYGGADAFKKALKEEAIKAIERSSHASGFADGHTKGLLKGLGIGGAIVGAIVGGIYFGKKVVDKNKARAEEKRKMEEEAQKAKEILVDDISEPCDEVK